MRAQTFSTRSIPNQRSIYYRFNVVVSEACAWKSSLTDNTFDESTQRGYTSRIEGEPHWREMDLCSKQRTLRLNAFKSVQFAYQFVGDVSFPENLIARHINIIIHFHLSPVWLRRILDLWLTSVSVQCSSFVRMVRFVLFFLAHSNATTTTLINDIIWIKQNKNGCEEQSLILPYCLAYSNYGKTFTYVDLVLLIDMAVDIHCICYFRHWHHRPVYLLCE